MNKTVENFKKILRIFKAYHRYEVIGLESFPLDMGVLLVTNHSLATYDGFLLGLEILERTGRMPRGLGDDLLFKIPILQNWCRDLGIEPASMHNAKKILRDKNILGVAPGGMREALKPSKERYKLLWHKRRGFIKLAILEQIPIVLGACPNADRVFKVYESFITAFVYRKFKVPLPVFKGLGPSYIPRPVKLIHHLSKPILPPKLNVNQNSEISEKVINEFHSIIVSEMQKLMSLKDYHPIL